MFQFGKANYISNEAEWEKKNRKKEKRSQMMRKLGPHFVTVTGSGSSSNRHTNRRAQERQRIYIKLVQEK